MAITAADLVAVYPEWEAAYINTPDVVEEAVAVANAIPLPLYSDPTEERSRRYLEACAVLFDHPFGRDMQLDSNAVNRYREEARRRDIRKGTMYRGPGWTDGWP